MRRKMLTIDKVKARGNQIKKSEQPLKIRKKAYVEPEKHNPRRKQEWVK